MRYPAPGLQNDTLQSPLALYGKMVYDREKCGECHSLDGKDKNLFSLDGVGRKYSLSWHYLHLEDPKLMVPGSDMPAFSKLTVSRIAKERFGGIWAADTDTVLINNSWEQLQQEATQLQEVLKASHIDAAPTNELLALLAFLVNRETSPEKLRADSLRTAQEARRSADWIAMARNPMSEMLLTAKNKNPMVVLSGKELFIMNCTPCHGQKAEGGIGPNLTDDYWLHGSSPEALVITIGNGVQDYGMKSWKNDFTQRQIGLLAAYIQSLRGSNPPNAKAPQGEKTN